MRSMRAGVRCWLFCSTAKADASVWGAVASGLGAQDLTPMSLGLSHSLSRYKLKFSPDKVRTILCQF